MSSIKRISPAAARESQDKYIDGIVSGHLDGDSSKAFKSLPTAGSLRPDASIIFAAAAGHPIACAIRDSWQPHFKVIVMDGNELDTRIAATASVFTGLDAELDVLSA